MGKESLTELNIYVVDDDPIFMKIITQFMEGVKMRLTSPVPFKFSYFDNTSTFFDSANENEAGIVILDYRLGNNDDADISGLEILEEVKAFNPKLRVISYTGDNSEILKNKLLFGGADHFVQKGAQSLKEFEKALTKEVAYLTR